ncbi:MAG: dipeptidase [Bacteroidota bacterium]
MNKILCILCPLAFLFACNAPKPRSTKTLGKADSLAHAFILTDGHVDLPYRMKVRNFRITREYLDFTEMTEQGNFDFERARKGGLDAPFMSIYIPAALQKTPGASKQLADSLIDMVEALAENYPDKFIVAKNPDDVEAAFAANKVALPMGMENGSPIEEDIANVQHFYDRGVRYITLTHSKVNNICDSSYDTTRTWNGLSPFGEQVVKEMNRVGIMVDVSHISDSAFYDVMALTDVPVIASHSSCRFYTPGFERNMNDDMLQVLKENGGVIQINFGSTFIDSTSQIERTKARRAFHTYMEENELEATDSLRTAFFETYYKTHPDFFSDVSVVADHIDHVAQLIGVDHVGFGSDFDGVGDSLPTDLKDVSQYPNLILELLERGYSDEDIEKICYKNVWRVWRAVEKAAES